MQTISKSSEVKQGQRVSLFKNGKEVSQATVAATTHPGSKNFLELELDLNEYVMTLVLVSGGWKEVEEGLGFELTEPTKDQPLFTITTT